MMNGEDRCIPSIAGGSPAIGIVTTRPSRVAQ